MRCYCCSDKTFSECCQPIIEGCCAESPEQLMRSRFSAYVLRNYTYILATYALKQRAQLSLQELSESAEGTRWCALNIISSSVNADAGTVEFIATYAVGSALFNMHEISSFKKHNQNWFYTTGVSGPNSGQLEPHRNETCPCGSGKKFKKCAHT